MPSPPTRSRPRVLLVANGDLHQSANEKCWPAQAVMEAKLGAVLGSLGTRLVRAHSYKPAQTHRFIASQKEGMKDFATIDPDAPLIVAEAVWQYSHHLLHGLISRQLVRHLARARRHAKPQRFAHQGGRNLLHAVE